MEHGIQLSGPTLGRPRDNPTENCNIVYNDVIDRIEIKRKFSLSKRCYGLGLIRTKFDTTTRRLIYLSINAMNIDRLGANFYMKF